MRQARHMTLAAICAIAILIGGCGGDDDGNGGSTTGAATGQAPSASTEQPPIQPQTPAQASSARGGTSDGTTPSAVVTAVTTDTIRALLPETLAGMKRTNAGAERNPSVGIDLPTGHAAYEGRDNASIDLQITDVGSMAEPMRMAMAAWTMIQYDRQTAAGYEKTGVYGGCKGMEEYDNGSKSGMLKVFVADRFVIELDGSNVTMDTLKQALGQIDFKRIASAASGS